MQMSKIETDFLKTYLKKLGNFFKCTANLSLTSEVLPKDHPVPYYFD